MKIYFLAVVQRIVYCDGDSLPEMIDILLPRYNYSAMSLSYNWLCAVVSITGCQPGEVREVTGNELTRDL